MKKIKYLTAGESHGKCLSLIVEGVPAGLQLSAWDIDGELWSVVIGSGEVTENGKRLGANSASKGRDCREGEIFC